MKLSLIYKILLIVLVSYYSSNIGIDIVEASASINRDRADYIKGQFALRSKAVYDQFNKFSDDVNQCFPDENEETLFGVTSTMNCLSGVLGLFNIGILSSALQLSTSILDLAHNFIDKSQKGDIGYTIARGVKGLIDQEISSFNFGYLGAVISGLGERMNNFYMYKTNSSEFNIFQEATEIDEYFIENKAQFQKSGYGLDTIGLFTLFANSHLLFLYDMITSGPSKYNFNSYQLNYFKNRFNPKITEYKNYIEQIDFLGSDAIEKKIKTQGIKNQDEWNERNDYYNFMNLYVYDISNYWEFLDPIKYPNGMFIENAHVSLSKLFGAPYKGESHLSAIDIENYISSNNLYQYQGKLKGIYYKNYNCRKDGNNFNLVKYLGGRQYFFRENQERDTKYLGDEGKLSGPKEYIEIDSGSIDSIFQYLARDKSPKSFSKDFHWGLSINNANIGDVSVYKTKSMLVPYPEKTITSVLPISYNKCSIGCSGKESSAYLVESAIIGFVNKDVIYDNIVFELTGTMVDAQKYSYANSFSGSDITYSRDGYKKYKHSMFISSYCSITYKINYNPFDNLIGNFTFQLDFRANSLNSNLNIRLSTFSITQDSYEYSLGVLKDKGQIYDLGFIKLYPSLTNYLVLSFSEPVYLSSLIFIPTQ